MITKMVSITVFTPVYNRAYIIEKLYKSLCQQSVKDFEWVIVNDGSTDNIDELVNEWLSRDNSFEISYISTPNQGKHCAINRGVEIAKGRLFFIVDSDDYLIEKAIELVLKKEREMPDHGFAGLAFNRGYNTNTVIGKTFLGHYIDATSLEKCKYHIMGDKAEIFYTDILKNYPFPKFEGENFLTENTIWYEIADDGYKLRWFNEIIYICHYLPDGLSADKTLGVRNIEGYTYSTKQMLGYNLPFIDKFKMIGSYMYAAKQNNLTFSEASKRIGANKLLLFIGYILIIVKRAIKDNSF